MMKDYIGADRMAKCRHSSACYCETVPNVSLKSAGCLSSQQAVCQVSRLFVKYRDQQPENAKDLRKGSYPSRESVNLRFMIQFLKSLSVERFTHLPFQSCFTFWFEYMIFQTAGKANVFRCPDWMRFYHGKKVLTFVPF